VPSAWGTRRDDYRWTRGHRDDIALFRDAAASLAHVLVYRPIAAWADLLPGAMGDVIGNTSNLHLADYWTFTLHHLVWAGHLPYSVNARWERGGGIDDDPFCFVSELPTDLIEASNEAMILFEERATHAIKDAASFVEQFTCPLDLRPYGLPVYEDGRWRLPPRSDAASLDAGTKGGSDGSRTGRAPEANNAAAPASDPESSDREAGGADTNATDVSSTEAAGEQAPALDEQSFTVRYAGRSYRFSARNKQLFALLERISQRPGFRVTFDDLRSVGDVWDGASVEDSTVRGAVARLRKLLAAQGMGPLSGRIVTGTYRGHCYVMLRLNESDERV